MTVAYRTQFVILLSKDERDLLDRTSGELSISRAEVFRKSLAEFASANGIAMIIIDHVGGDENDGSGDRTDSD